MHAISPKPAADSAPKTVSRGVLGVSEWHSGSEADAERSLSEDALLLNIWKPAKPSNEPLPVMVWFEGGSFMTISPSNTRIDGVAIWEIAYGFRPLPDPGARR